jgi:ornithine cyclodeaminase/alanine dehydrogenase-like protein (mu-crystallin family)
MMVAGRPGFRPAPGWREAKILSMAIYITEDDVRALVTVDDAMAALEQAFAHWGAEGTVNMPRRRMPLPERSMNLMAASLPADGVCGHKAYFGGCQYFSLFSLTDRKMLALMEASTLGATRTGAATGVAAKYLAREDAATVGLIGTGRQARTQLIAACRARPIRQARVFSRTEEKRTRFALEIASELGLEVTPATDAESCIRGADIAIAMTTSAEPVILGDWLAPGAFVAGTGANAYARQELDTAVLTRAGRVVTDQRDQARVEARELIDLAEAGMLSWDEVIELGDIICGRAPGRQSDDEITVYKSLGIALEDVAFGKMIYDRAVAQGVGRHIDGT